MSNENGTVELQENIPREFIAHVISAGILDSNARTSHLDSASVADNLIFFIF